MAKIWFITGAGSGIGRAIALEALGQGDCVVATTRKADGFEAPSNCGDRLLSLQLDVSEQDPVTYEAAVAAAIERFGRVDVLVNNAGYGAVTFFEETSEQAGEHIEDYDACRRQTALVADCQKHLQPGDPAKLAKVVYAAVTCDNPPLHLAIGEDGPSVLDAYRAKTQEDTDAWRDVACATSFDE